MSPLSEPVVVAGVPVYDEVVPVVVPTAVSAVSVVDTVPDVVVVVPGAVTPVSPVSADSTATVPVQSVAVVPSITSLLPPPEQPAVTTSQLLTMVVVLAPMTGPPGASLPHASLVRVPFSPQAYCSRAARSASDSGTFSPVP